MIDRSPCTSDPCDAGLPDRPLPSPAGHELLVGRRPPPPVLHARGGRCPYTSQPSRLPPGPGQLGLLPVATAHPLASTHTSSPSSGSGSSTTNSPRPASFDLEVLTIKANLPFSNLLVWRESEDSSICGGVLVFIWSESCTTFLSVHIRSKGNFRDSS
jgi:hypothetical protein